MLPPHLIDDFSHIFFEHQILGDPSELLEFLTVSDISSLNDHKDMVRKSRIIIKI